MVNAKHSIPIESEIARELKLSSVLDYDTTKGLQKIAINAEGLSKSFGGALQSFNLIAAYTNKGWDWPTLKPSLAYNINEQIQVGASFKADNKGLSNLWPQILFRHEKLGPSTIVGSASFNLLAISAVCIAGVPTGEIRRIKAFPVFIITSFFSIFAYIWIVIVLVVSTPVTC